jgi:NADH dehydrogenase [ubiquinone] 1 alpha subcomplex assembly factor 7
VSGAAAATATASDTDAAAPTPLYGRLVPRIAQDGPMTVAEFMLACLHDPRDGYYATRPALGPQGDFLTAPLVSQMFGELIGAWLAHVWTQMGRPSPVRLVELGPGDGTLMSDAMRAMATVAGLGDAIDLWLVEPSRPLRRLQAEQLAAAEPRFADSLAQVPGDAPLLLVANEVFDCLPARQFVRTDGGWCERRVGLDAGGGLVFGLAPLPSGVVDGLCDDAPVGAVAERSPAQLALGAEVGTRIAEDGGAALILDYGAAERGLGDTLQAVQRHRKVEPLATAGEADLTVHVDVAGVAWAARQAGAVTRTAQQGDFLRAMGIVARARRLTEARPDLNDVIARQVDRLTGPMEMGELFKALAVHSPGLAPPGFEEPTA